MCAKGLVMGLYDNLGDKLFYTRGILHYYSGTKITQSSAGSKYTHDSSGMARNVTSHRLREYVAPSGASCVSNRQVGGCAQWSVLVAASHAGVVARRRVAPPPPAAAAARRT